MPLTALTVLSRNLPDYGVLTRAEFVDEFAYRYEPGQHLIALGPTGRGKTTLIGQILPHCKTSGTVISCLGEDPALAHLGKSISYWPPKRPEWMIRYDEPTIVRRFQDIPRKPEDFSRIRRTNFTILRWMFARPDWTLFYPDLQIITDPRMMNLGKEVEQLILTLRKAGSSVWMDAQAPRWIPSAAKDQVQHLLLWRNRNKTVMKSLSDIAGLDVDVVDGMFRDMQWHEAIWVDIRADEYFLVLAS